MSCVLRICSRLSSNGGNYICHGNIIKQPFTKLLYREIACTSSLPFRQKNHRDLKKESLMDRFDRLMISVLKRWPFLKDYYYTMSKGFRRQGSDFKMWWRVNSKLRSDPGYQTTYQEHKAVFDSKGSLMKSSILLPLFMLPFGIVIIFIPVALFPQFMLPRCYWNKKQRTKYFTTMNQNRVIRNNIVIHHLGYLKNNHRSDNLRQALEPILKAVNDAHIPTNSDLLRLQACCRGTDNPLNVSQLPPLLLATLCHINFLWKYLPPQWLAYYLNQRAILILEFDKKLRNENLIDFLPEDELQDATFLRGLDCASLSKEANRYWLKNWVAHTRDFTVSDASYVIHAMILLSVNYTGLRYKRRVFDKT